MTQSPPLIAATKSGTSYLETSPAVNETGEVDMAQVFFVRGKYQWTTEGPYTAILNASVAVDGNVWSVSTLGQEPDEIPNSNMQMPS